MTSFITFRNTALATSLVFGLGIAHLTPAIGSAFWPGTVINIATGDDLKIRKWPSASSVIRNQADEGDNLSLTGRCKNIATGVSFRIDGAGSLNLKYNRMKKPYVWCQLMHEPTVGYPELGWARGKYIWPN